MNIFDLTESPKLAAPSNSIGAQSTADQSSPSVIGSGTTKREAKKKPVTMMGVAVKEDIDEGWFDAAKKAAIWFLKKDGQILRTALGEPFTFKDKEAAIAWAKKNYKVSFDQQRIYPTTNPEKNLIREPQVSEAGKKIKSNFKMPPESLQDKMYRRHQELRKQRGLPDPEEYKQRIAQKQAEIDALKEGILDRAAPKLPKPRNPAEKVLRNKVNAAGAHKDKKKAQKQGDFKHKGQDPLDEGWKSALAGAALAGGIALGGAAHAAEPVVGMGQSQNMQMAVDMAKMNAKVKYLKTVYGDNFQDKQMPEHHFGKMDLKPNDKGGYIATVPLIVDGEVQEGVAEGSLEEYGDTARGQKQLTRVHKRAVDRTIKADDKNRSEPDVAKRDLKTVRKNAATADRAWERMSDKDLDEAGPFSYGAKKPRKGSVADLAARKRKEQERDKQPAEPRDHMVGVAKVIKGVAEGSLNEFAPDDSGDERTYEYEVYQCNPQDQFDWIGGPIYKSDDMGKVHGVAYELWKKHPDKAFMVWQERSQGSRGRYGPKDNEQGVAEGSEDDIEDTRQFRNAIALAQSQKAIRQAKHGKDTKFYADGTPVTPEETARRAAERKAKKQGVAEGSLNEFAPGGNDGNDDHDHLRRLARQIFRAMPQNLTSDYILDYLDIVPYIEHKSELVKQLANLDQQSQVWVVDEIANMFYELNGGGGEQGVAEGSKTQVPWEAVVTAIVYDQFDTLMDRYGLTFDDIEHIVQQHGFASSDDVRAEYSQSLEEGLKDPKDNPCWDGYKPVGTKKKAGKTVPNCVPTNEEIERHLFLMSRAGYDIIQEEWSDKYKRSINCSNPKGFSQKAHCAGRKKNEDVTEEEVRLDPKCWKGKKIGNPKTKMKGGVRVNNCVPK